MGDGPHVSTAFTKAATYAFLPLTCLPNFTLLNAGSLKSSRGGVWQSPRGVQPQNSSCNLSRGSSHPLSHQESDERHALVPADLCISSLSKRRTTLPTSSLINLTYATTWRVFPAAYFGLFQYLPTAIRRASFRLPNAWHSARTPLHSKPLRQSLPSPREKLPTDDY